MVPRAAGLVFLAVALADWSRGGAPGQAAPGLHVWARQLRLRVGRTVGPVVNVVKVLFGRARARLLDRRHYFDPLTFGYLNASFPSGGSTTVGAMTGIWTTRFPRWSLLIAPAWPVFAATRIAAQAHYPSDGGRWPTRSAGSFLIMVGRAGSPDAACPPLSISV